MCFFGREGAGIWNSIDQFLNGTMFYIVCGAIQNDEPHFIEFYLISTSIPLCMKKLIKLFMCVKYSVCFLRLCFSFFFVFLRFCCFCCANYDEKRMFGWKFVWKLYCQVWLQNGNNVTYLFMECNFFVWTMLSKFRNSHFNIFVCVAYTTHNVSSQNDRFQQNVILMRLTSGSGFLS